MASTFWGGDAYFSADEYDDLPDLSDYEDDLVDRVVDTKVCNDLVAKRPPNYLRTLEQMCKSTRLDACCLPVRMHDAQELAARAVMERQQTIRQLGDMHREMNAQLQALFARQEALDAQIKQNLHIQNTTLVKDMPSAETKRLKVALGDMLREKDELDAAVSANFGQQMKLKLEQERLEREVASLQ